MFRARQAGPNNSFRVTIDVPPPYDMDMENDYNDAWNVRTLTLMSRVGLIDIDGEPPPRFLNDEETDVEDREAIYEQAYNNYLNSRLIRITDEGHLDQVTWENKVEPARRRSIDQAKLSLSLMFEALRGERCMSEILADAYSIPGNHVMPIKACGGCPHCRHTRRRPFAGPMPVPLPVWDPSDDLGRGVKAFMSSRGNLTIFYRPAKNKGRERRSLEVVVKWLVNQGVRNIVVPKSHYTELIGCVSEAPTGAYMFFFEQYKPTLMPRVPTLIFCPAEHAVSASWLAQGDGRATAPPMILLLPLDAVDPGNKARLLRDTVSPFLTLEELISKVGL